MADKKAKVPAELSETYEIDGIFDEPVIFEVSAEMPYLEYRDKFASDVVQFNDILTWFTDYLSVRTKAGKDIPLRSLSRKQLLMIWRHYEQHPLGYLSTENPSETAEQA